MGSIYHYTDLNAVVSILNQLKLRATEIGYLNDSTEFVDGGRYILKEVERVVTQHTNGNGLSSGASLRKLQSVLSYQYPHTLHWAMVTSFSRAYDQLSQWRGYGLYCIEFDESILSECLPLNECVYGINDKKMLAASAVSDGLAALDAFYKVHPEDPNAPMNEPHDIALAVGGKAVIFKHEGFAEEQEVRAIFDVWEHYIPDDRKHRIRGDMIIPFIEVAIPSESIKSITVGPMNNQSMAIASLISFLQSWQDNPAEPKGVPIFHDIEVRGSLVPFRSA